MTKRLFSVCLAALLLFCAAAVAEPHISTRLLVLLEKETDAVYLFRGGWHPTEAVVGMRLIPGDLIATGPDATAFFQADEDKIFQLGPSGRVIISKADDSSLLLTLQAGELFFDILSPLGETETLDIQAGNTTMSIRGTSGRYVYMEESTVVEIFHGAVDVSTQEQTYTVRTNDRLTLTFDGDTHTATEEATITPDETFVLFLSDAQKLVTEHPEPASPPEMIVSLEDNAPLPVLLPPESGDIVDIVMPSLSACPHCSQAGVPSPEAHLCAYCKTFTCFNPLGHGMDICGITCTVCGQAAASADAHRCSYRNCGGYICDEAHRSN